MDPDACLTRLLDAAVAGDAEDLLAAADDLADWLRHGGYPPKDPRELHR
jgi:hypothetical protein